MTLDLLLQIIKDKFKSLEGYELKDFTNVYGGVRWNAELELLKWILEEYEKRLEDKKSKRLRKRTDVDPRRERKD